MNFSFKHFVFLSIILLFVQGCNVQPTAKLAVYGDSVSWGYGDLPGGWVKKVEDKTGMTISNLGVPGERVDGGVGRIDLAMRSAPGAKVVFLLHGGNNWVKAFRSTWCQAECEPEVVENKYEIAGNNLRKMRDAIQQKGKRTVFITYWPNSNSACSNYTEEKYILYQKHRMRLNTEIQMIADEHNDHVIRTDDMQNIGDGTDFFDCLHPSSRGYEKIADRILSDFDDWNPGEPDFSDTFDLRF